MKKMETAMLKNFESLGKPSIGFLSLLNVQMWKSWDFCDQKIIKLKSNELINYRTHF